MLRRLTLPAVLVLAALAAPAAVNDEARWRAERERMVADTIARPLDGRDPVRDQRVLEAMRAVPRHEFVPLEWSDHAYGDHPVPIGHGQTISQPYVVAKMTELLRPQPGDRVLEVGTGSGYQAAVLALLVREVYTIEILEPLGTSARQRLTRLGYRNVEVRIGDGTRGWPEKAPFDSILVTAWATEVPRPLAEQLKPGGRMVLPLGPDLAHQTLVVVHRGKTPKDLRVEPVLPVAFVPLVGEDRTPKR